MKKLLLLLFAVLCLSSCSTENDYNSENYIYIGFNPSKPDVQLFSFDMDFSKGSEIENNINSENYIRMDIGDLSYTAEVITSYSAQEITMSNTSTYDGLLNRNSKGTKFTMIGRTEDLNIPEDEYYIFTIKTR